MNVSVTWGAKNAGAKYNVKGDSLEGALKSLETRDEWGEFKGDIDFQSKGDAAGNVSSVLLKPTYTITLPVWPAYGKQPKSCKTEWDRMFVALRKHEDGHRALFEAGLAKLVTKLKALKAGKHSDIADLMEEARSDIQAEHDSYDSRTKHGETEGVSLTIEEECRSK